MKSYLVTTGIAFVLVLAAHVARLAAEGPHLLREPMFLATSLLALALALWAATLLRRTLGRSA